MSLNCEDKILHPLELSKIKSEGKTIYDRNTRGKSYFYLALIYHEPVFYTLNGEYFCTKENDYFLTQPEEV